MFENWCFMFTKYIHHPGLAAIQFSAFFHMCRLDSISYEMEKWSGTTFTLFDCLQGAVLGVLTTAEDRYQALNFMADALQFIQNTAGVVPPRGDTKDSPALDEYSFVDTMLRIKNIQKVFEKRVKKIGTEKVSFINEMMIH